MPGPTLSDVHVDVPLSNISTAYKNEKYIGDMILPKVDVQKQSDKFYAWTKDFWFRNTVEERAPGDSYPEGSFGLTQDNYACNIYHASKPVNDEDRKNQDPAIDLERTASEWLAEQFMLNMEILIANTVFKTGVWGTDAVGGSAHTVWSNYTSSTPEVDLDTGMRTVQSTTGIDPAFLAVGREVHDKLRRHPKLLDIFKYTSRAILTKEMISDALGISKYLVGNSIEVKTLEGATAAYTRIWGKNAFLYHVPPTPGLMVPSAGYTFVWPIDGPGGFKVEIRPWRDDARDRDLYRGKTSFDNKVIGKDLGYFYSAIVA